MPDRLAPAVYARVFEGHHEGVQVLADLVRRFYDVNVYVAGGVEAQRETERRAARREVVQFILSQMAQVNEAPEPDDPQPSP